MIADFPKASWSRRFFSHSILVVCPSAFAIGWQRFQCSIQPLVCQLTGFYHKFCIWFPIVPRIRLHLSYVQKVKRFKYKLLNQTKKESYFTAGLSISLDCKPRVMYKLSRQPKKIARRCTLWMLGRVPGRPKRCMLCNENDEHGWRHFEHCLGMSELKNTMYSPASTTIAAPERHSFRHRG